MFLMIIGFVDLLVQSYGVRAGSFLCPHLGRVGKWASLAAFKNFITFTW